MRAPRATAVGRAGAVLALSAALAGCLDDTAGATGSPPSAVAAGACRPGELLVAVASDYQSSATAILDLAHPRALASRFLHSGSHVGATGAALSGDVVPATGADCRSRIVDRARGVITALVHGDGSAPGISGQWNVSGGFFSNVQDVAVLGEDLWGVIRAQRRPGRTAVSAAGDDLLVYRPSAASRAARVPLGPFSTLAGAFAFGGRTAVLRAKASGWRVIVPLASVSPTFDAMGPGRVVLVAGATDRAAVRAAIDLPGKLRNCTTARSIPDVDGGLGPVAVLCSGFFKSSRQAEESGLVLLDAGGSTPAVQLVIAATATRSANPRPFFGDLACDAHRCFAIALGEGAGQRADELWELPLQAGYIPRLVHTASAPFVSSGLYYDRARERLWFTDSEHTPGDVLVARCRWPTPCAPLTSLRSNTLGLAAIALEGP